jgi:hypothetical protein
MFNPIEKLSFQQKMMKLITIWLLVIATVFIGIVARNSLKQKYLAIETEVYKTDNSLCELGKLQEGDSIFYANKNREIEKIDYFSWGELRIEFKSNK